MTSTYGLLEHVRSCRVKHVHVDVKKNERADIHDISQQSKNLNVDVKNTNYHRR